MAARSGSHKGEKKTSAKLNGFLIIRGPVQDVAGITLFLWVGIVKPGNICQAGKGRGIEKNRKP